MKMTVTLSSSEIQSLIKEYLSTKFKNVGDVKLEIVKELVGHHYNEHYVTKFKGAIVEVDTDSEQSQ